MSIDTPRPPDTNTIRTSRAARSILNTNTSNFADTSLEVSSNENNDEFDVANTILDRNVSPGMGTSTEVIITDYVENDTLIISDNLEKGANFDNLSLTLMFDITGNDYEFNEPIEKINEISNIKNSILSDSFYSVIENQFKSVLKKVNGYKYITERINEKVNNTEGVVGLFDDGISLRQETINNLSYIKNLNDSVIKNSENRRFKKITNFFIDNVVSDDITQYENNVSDLNAAFDVEDQRGRLKFITNNDELSKFLMIDISEFEEILKPKDEVSIVVQNFVNNTRSIYTVMPNCIGNNSDILNNHVVSYKDNIREVFLNENIDVDVWRNISTGKKINYSSLSSLYFNRDRFGNIVNRISIPIQDLEKLQEFHVIRNTVMNTDLTDVAAARSIRTQFDASNEEDGNDNSSTNPNTVILSNLNILESFNNGYKLTPYFKNFKTLNLFESYNDIKHIVNVFLYIQSLPRAKKLFIYDMPLEYWKESLEKNFFDITFKETYVDHFLKIILQSNQLANDNDMANEASNVGLTNNLLDKGSYKDKLDMLNKILRGDAGRLSDVNGPIEEAKRKLYNITESTETINVFTASGFYPIDLSTNNTLNVIDNPGARQLPSTRASNVNQDNQNEPVLQLNGENFTLTQLKSYVDILKSKISGTVKNLYFNYNKVFYMLNNEAIFDHHKTISSNFSLDEVNFKLKIDSLVKEIKLKHLNSKNISFDFYDQIVKNIKNRRYSIKSKLISYLSKDNDNISVLNKNDKIYNFLFTELNEKEHQSNVSLSLKAHNLNEITYRSTLNKSFNKDVSDDITTFISNYYPKGFFFSSTTLTKEIIKDCKEYINNFSNSLSKDEVVSEILYLNFFNKKINKSLKEKDKKDVAKRFLFAAIQNDITTSESLKKSNLKNYTYDTSIFDNFSKKVEKETAILDKDSETFYKEVRKVIRSKMLETYDEYKNSAVDLYNIEKAVYNIKFFNEIKKEYNFSLLDALRDVYFKIEHIFPFTHEIEVDHIGRRSSRLKKNSLFSNTTIYPKIYINSKGQVNFNESILGFVINGKIKHYLTTNDEINKDKLDDDVGFFVIDERPGVYITDYFYECIANRENSIFNKILEKIKNILRLTVADYLGKEFDSEDTIKNFINENEHVLEHCVCLLEIYSEFFHDIFRKILFDYNQKIFEKIYDPYEIKNDCYITKDKLEGTISRGRFNTLIDTFNISRLSEVSLFVQNNNSDNFIFTPSETLSNYYKELLENFDNQNGVFNYDESETEGKIYYNEELDADDFFCKKIHDVIYSLKKSDVYQAFSFDLTREALRTSLEIENNLDKVKNKDLLTFVEKFNFNNDDFFKNIDNKYYQNMIKRNMNNVTTRNLLLKQNVIETIYAEDNSKSMEDAYNDLKVFNTFKEEYSYSRVNVNDDFVYAFDLPYEKIKNLSEDIIIKVTIQAKDTKNTNRMFYPVIRYFSPNLVSKNFNINSDVNNLIYFTSDNNTSNINGTDFLEANPDMQRYLSDLVSSRLKPKTVQQRENFIRNIIESHNKSIELNKMLYVKHDINLHKDSYNKNDEMTNLVQTISDNVSKNIFGLNKSQLTNVDLLNNKFNSTMLMNNNLNLLLSKERDSLEITSLDSYDHYLISIGEDDLIYNDITLTDRYNNLTKVEFDSLNTYNRTSLYELINYQSNEYLYRQFDRINVNEREFLTFIVKTEFI